MIKINMVITLFMFIVGICVFRSEGTITLTVPPAGNCGDDTVLTCHVTGSVNRNHRSWIGLNNPLVTDGAVVRPEYISKYTETLGTTSFTLTIHNTDITDEGEYKCENGFDRSPTVRLNVECKASSAVHSVTDGKKIKIAVDKLYPSWPTFTASFKKETMVVNILGSRTCSSSTQYSGYYRCVWSSSNSFADGSYTFSIVVTTITEADPVTGSFDIVSPRLPVIADTITLNSSRMVLYGNEGQSLTIQCTSTGGNPSPTVVWYKESVSNSNQLASTSTGTLQSDDTYTVTLQHTLTPTLADDKKTLICRSYYPLADSAFRGSNTTSVILYLRHGPDSVTVVPGNQTYLVDEGSRLQDIKCSADCFPECKYRWTREGQTQSISNIETLSLGTLQKSSAGKYTCTATNGDTSSKWRQRHVVITVRYGPYNSSTILTPEAKEYTRNEGTVLSDITCSADCYPACTDTWYKVQQTSSLLVRNGSILSLGQLTHDEAAIYTCTARNPGKMNSPTTSVQVKVYVRYGPDSLAISVQSPFTVTEGETVADIICSSECYPDCSYSWTNVTANSRSSSNSSLYLRKVNRYMAGSYKCTGWNTATNYYTNVKEKTIDIIVNHAPDVSIRFSTTNVTEGANLTLFCEGAGVPSSYSYTSLTQKWNNIRIHNTNTELEGSEKFSSIHFDRLTLQDSGTYTCTLNNGIRNTFGVLNQTGSENILVKARPKFLKNELRFTGATGGIANIQVPVYSYPHYKSLHLVKGENKTIVFGQKYNITEQYHTVKSTFYNTDVMLNGTLLNFTITDLEEGDFSNYTLQITNDLGMSSVKITAIAEGRPSSPKGFQFLSENSIPTFMWMKNFNGGLKQSFVIQISLADTDKWSNRTNIKENDQQYKINETFFMANITGLPPGIYSARIFAYNTKGESDFVLLPQIFEVKREEAKVRNVPSSLIGGVAGGVTAVVIIAVVFVFVVIIRHRNMCTKRTILATLQNYVGKNKEADNSKLEMNPCDNSRDMYEQLQQGTDRPERNVYDSLEVNSQRNIKDKIVYENLKQAVGESPLHSTLPADSTRNNPTYVNLKL